MSVEELDAPICQHKNDKEDDPCGKRMFRIGTSNLSAWVCERCDKVDPAMAIH